MRTVPVVLALARRGVAGFLIAQWATRPSPAVVSSEAPASSAAPAPGRRTADACRLAPTRPRSCRRTPSGRAAPSPHAPSQAPSSRSRRVRASGSGRPLAARAAAAPTPRRPSPSFALQAVTEQDGQPVAIVNGQLVRVGDVVDGARVLRIDAEAVELEKDGRRFVIAF